MKYYKTTDSDGNLQRIDKSSVKASGEEITQVEYNLLKAAIQIEGGAKAANDIAKESWWK